jgi:hypothetical protein
MRVSELVLTDLWDYLLILPHYYPGIGSGNGVNNMLQTAMDSKTFKIVYGAGFPIVVIILLLGVASLSSRPSVLGSTASDLIIRCFLTIWFCALYIRLSRISSFSHYPNKKWTKADVGSIEKYVYWIMSIFFGVVCGVVTWWIIQWFFPVIAFLAYVISAVNFLIIVLPLVTHYWVLKL